MGEEEDRKVFVGGLAQECSQDDLRQYFSQFGETERVQLKMDFQTGRSRGFAFVVFRDASGMEATLAQGEDHQIKVQKINYIEFIIPFRLRILTVSLIVHAAERAFDRRKR